MHHILIALGLCWLPFGTTQVTQKAPPILHVVLLAGQSNMEGQAVVDLDHEEHYNGGRGTLVDVLNNPDAQERWGHLRNEAGEWVVRDDVGVWYRSAHETKIGALSIGYAVYGGRHHFGPELGIGHMLGNLFGEPVLLVKAAWGGKSLDVDFRPPSAEGETGEYYEKMFAELDTAMADIGSSFPQWKDHEPRIEGFVWFQGWNDGCDEQATAAYATNLTHLIGDVRKRLKLPGLPVVVGETGNMDKPVLHAAQRAGCQHESVMDNTVFVPTRAFQRQAKDSPNVGHGHHWFGNAESYLLIGDALGEALSTLLRENE
ncbi:MAG: hypothetical protein ACI841_002906 [Planctomycetota bacterium]|jgi:hypothetical protein